MISRFLTPRPSIANPIQEMRKAPLIRKSLSSCLTSSFAVQTRALSSSPLAFLYQTRTLLSEPKTATPSHAINNRDIRRRTLFSATRSQAYAGEEHRAKNDPIVFVDPYHKRIPNTLSQDEPQKQNQASRPSTVTASEQAVFNRLVKEVSQPADAELDDEDIPDQDEPVSGYDPNVDLNSIFEDAIKQLRWHQEQRANSVTRSLLYATIPRQRAIDTVVSDGEQALSPHVFKRPLKLAGGTTLWNEAETEEERARHEIACDDHRKLVMAMLDSAKSDVDIWQILEKEVFSLITQLDEHLKLVERAKKEETLHAAKVRKAEAEGIDVADVKLEKRDLTKKEMSTMKLTQTKAIPIDSLLSIVHRNYADYCLDALRLLRRNYPTSPYAPHVLSTIKQRGPISYVLGISTEIYNEILFLQWTQYSDLHGMADTMEEMINQGIESNEVTIALIKGIARQRRGARRNLSGPMMKEWWYMRGIGDGWTRVHNLFGRIMSELDQKEALLVDEAESDEDGEMYTDKE